MAGQPVHSVLFDASDQPSYYDPSHSAQTDNLQFYPSSYGDPSGYGAPQYGAYPPPGPDMSGQTSYMGASYAGGSTSSFWSAFGTGGFADEPPLLEELGINFLHIKSKSLTVLNPLHPVDKHIMYDTDLAGPLLFCLLFGLFLAFSGKVHFGYIYGVAVLGVLSLFLILNLMSEGGVDGYRIASVLGYCLLPMVMLSGLSIIFGLAGPIGFILSVFSIFWCTYASSGMFVTVLGMSEQRFLVAYPVGLFYACFALMTVF